MLGDAAFFDWLEVNAPAMAAGDAAARQYAVRQSVEMKAGIVERLISLANALVGRVRGGMAQVTMLSGAGLATVSGAAEAGSTVTVSIDGAVAGTATANGSGAWSFTAAAWRASPSIAGCSRPRCPARTPQASAGRRP